MKQITNELRDYPDGLRYDFLTHRWLIEWADKGSTKAAYSTDGITWSSTKLTDKSGTDEALVPVAYHLRRKTNENTKI